MSARIRTAGVVGLAGVTCLALTATGAPGAFAADSVTGDVDITSTETVQVLMDSDGSIDAQRVYEQLSFKGNGAVDVSNPVSDKNLRNLDGFGGFDERDGEMRVKTDVDGVKRYRSVSDYTKSLPLQVEVRYTLDGESIEPKDLVGKSGTIGVRYTVKNVSGKTEQVSFEDGDGNTVEKTENVVVPMVGSLTTVLPQSFTKVRSAEANAAGDGRGGTQLSFTMTLIPPIGSDIAEFGYTAEVNDIRVPKASLSALPVNPLESPSFKGGAAAYQGGAETGQTLTAGATEIDANVLKLRDGAATLVDGLFQLRDGADQLSVGLGAKAAPGAQKLAAGAGKLDSGAKQLADGTGQLSAGAGKLDDGAGKLSDGTGKLSAGADKLNAGATDLSAGLDSASSNGPALLAGVDQLLTGAKAVDAGLTQLYGGVKPGADGIASGATQLLGAVNTQLVPGLDGASAAIDRALAAADKLPDSAEKSTITGNLSGAKTAIGQVRGGLTGSVTTGLTGIRDGGTGISTAVENNIGSNGAIKIGTGRLVLGLTDLQTKGKQLVDGLNKLSVGATQLKAGTGDLSQGASDLDAGAGQLAAGTGDLKSGADKLNSGAGKLKGGTGQLSAGAITLSSGLLDAANGSGRLADGLDQAAEKAPALPEGAGRLSEEGTSKLIEAGDETASEFGLKYALLEAGTARAATAQPYGSPEGAVERTAFKFEIAGADGAESKNLKRGGAAVVLLAAAAGVAALRRRIV